MAIIHNWEADGLHTQYIGRTSGDELISSVLKLSGDSRFDDLKYIIGDWSASEGEIDYIIPKDIEKLAYYIDAMSKTNPNIINPSILPDGEHRQALVSYYAMLTEDLSWQIDWFHTEQEAREWISNLLQSK